MELRLSQCKKRFSFLVFDDDILNIICMREVLSSIFSVRQSTHWRVFQGIYHFGLSSDGFWEHLCILLWWKISVFWLRLSVPARIAHLLSRSSKFATDCTHEKCFVTQRYRRLVQLSCKGWTCKFDFSSVTYPLISAGISVHPRFFEYVTLLTLVELSCIEVVTASCFILSLPHVVSLLTCGGKAAEDRVCLSCRQIRKISNDFQLSLIDWLNWVCHEKLEIKQIKNKNQFIGQVVHRIRPTLSVEP